MVAVDCNLPLALVGDEQVCAVAPLVQEASIVLAAELITLAFRQVAPHPVLMAPDRLNKVWIMRKILTQMSAVEAMELLTDKLAKSKSNEDFLKMMQNPVG